MSMELLIGETAGALLGLLAGSLCITMIMTLLSYVSQLL